MYQEARGIIKELLDTKYGKTKSGKDYEKRDYLLELNPGSQWVHSLKFTLSSFDGPIQNPPEIGDSVKVGLNIVAHQFNGKWYNDVSAMSLEKLA